MPDESRTLRILPLLTVVLFAVSGITIFYMGLDYTLGGLWGTERSDHNNAAGASALILAVAVVAALTSGLKRSTSKAAVMSGWLAAGLVAAAVPWLAKL